jgi:hypothetical protein
VSDENRVRLLYHFTTAEHLAEILSTEQISLSRSPVVARGHRRATPVVWLTDDADADTGVDRGFDHDSRRDVAGEPRTARITVAVSDAQRWSQWAPRHKVSNKTRRQLDAVGGGQSGRWWVVVRAIPASEWLRVEDLHTGQTLWSRPDPISGREEG